MGLQDISRRLMYYKRKEIQEAIAASCLDREVGTRIGSRGFGKRPDMLTYPNEVLSLVQKGVTSFHISEERWSDPLALQPGMSKREQDDLRIGWDLVLDVDVPGWDFSRLTAHLFYKALVAHGINCVTAKFSGNKGFHLGVPFEAFPDSIAGIEAREWFPDGPKKVTQYLLDYISKNFVKYSGERIIFDNNYVYSLERLAKELKLDIKKLTYTSRCKACKKPIKEAQSSKVEWVCSRCGNRIMSDEETSIKVCPRCDTIMEKFIHPSKACECGSTETENYISFDPFAAIQIDTVLISSRHMFRSPYSLHEKSGLVSIPIMPEEILGFDKERAIPEKVDPLRCPQFLNRDTINDKDARQLLFTAMEFKPKIASPGFGKEETKTREIEEIMDAVPKELFPPCILKILEGLEDGRKRALFVLLNFLKSCAWTHDAIQEELTQWNLRNKEKLRQNVLTSHLRYHKTKEKVLPPNCRDYYEDLGVCFPDSLCEKITNPVSYSRIKSGSGKKKGGRKKLTEEQKRMRREYRQKIKRQKQKKKS